jgi:hypothetical protein
MIEIWRLKTTDTGPEWSERMFYKDMNESLKEEIFILKNDAHLKRQSVFGVKYKDGGIAPFCFLRPCQSTAVWRSVAFLQRYGV